MQWLFSPNSAGAKDMWTSTQQVNKTGESGYGEEAN